MQFPEFKNEKTGISVKHEFVECSGLWNYTAWKGKECIGRVIVIQHNPFKPIIDKDEEIFMEIVIFNEEHRGKGIAKELMQFVQNIGNHKVLISSSLDKRGKELGLKTGWKIKKGLTKKQPDILYFKKEE